MERPPGSDPSSSGPSSSSGTTGECVTPTRVSPSRLLIPAPRFPDGFAGFAANAAGGGGGGAGSGGVSSGNADVTLECEEPDFDYPPLSAMSIADGPPVPRFDSAGNPIVSPFHRDVSVGGFDASGYPMSPMMASPGPGGVPLSPGGVPPYSPMAFSPMAISPAPARVQRGAAPAPTANAAVAPPMTAGPDPLPPGRGGGAPFPPPAAAPSAAAVGGAAEVGLKSWLAQKRGAFINGKEV